MNRFKAMTYLLVFLLIFNSFLTGCTVSGYAIGEQTDIKNAKNLGKVTFDKIGIGDTVDVFLLDQTKIRGRVESLDHSSYIVLLDLDPKLKEMSNKELKTYKLDEIADIQKVKIRKWYRVFGTVLGFAIDVSIPVLLFLAYSGPMGTS